MTALTLHVAQPTDAGAVGAILSAFIDTTEWMPRIHTRAEDLSFAGTMIDRGWVRVARHNAQVVGFLAREDNAIHALYVAPEYQNQGVGAALLQEAQRSQTHLSLFTFQANLGAQRFYVRHGFAEAGRSDGAENDEGLPDLRYVWRAAEGAQDEP